MFLFYLHNFYSSLIKIIFIMTHPNSVHNLVEHIKSISSSRNKSSPDKLSQTQLKLLMSQDYKNPWKSIIFFITDSGVVRKGNEIDRLPIGDLDNWEILRVNMSKRSYNYPKSTHEIS